MPQLNKEMQQKTSKTASCKYTKTKRIARKNTKGMCNGV